MKRVVTTTKTLLATLIFLFSVTYSNLCGAEHFENKYNITYKINDSGETEVIQNISIQNLQDDVIATGYTLSAGKISTYDERASQEDKGLTVKKEETADGSLISITLRKPIIGRDKSSVFTISFKTRDIAVKTGNIWTVNIPRAQIPGASAQYNIKIEVPRSFGPKIFISPLPDTQTDTEFTFSNKTINDGRITAAFGNYQLINFQLTYQIQNPLLVPATYEIALPMDIIQKQQIKYSKLDPLPKNIYMDGDGNVIAKYKLAKKEKMEVKLTGSAKVVAEQIDPSLGGNFADIPRSLKKTYTKEQRYWELRGEKVLEITKKLYQPDKNVVENARNVYNYLVTNLKYNNSSTGQTFVSRQGAQKALTENTNIACMEFTDSFIALTRKMGIPSREINGYAFSEAGNNKPLSINLRGGDFLHSWAEFYDPKYGWVQVDPTWGSTSGIDYFTKLDTSHLAFIRRGVNSQKPLPAGAYRFETDSKLVRVDFSQDADDQTFAEDLTIHKKTTLNPIMVLLNKQKYQIKNIGKVFVYNIGNIKYLAPNQESYIYLPKDSTTITYQTFDGNTITKSLDISL